jgi:hypothetical protein
MRCHCAIVPQGVYHGIFPGAERGMLGEPTTLWVVSRPHNSRPDASKEWLLHLDMESGRELGRVQVRRCTGARG